MVVINKGYVYALRSAARQTVNEKVLPDLNNVYVLPPDPARPERITFTNGSAAALIMFTELQRRQFKTYTRYKIDSIIGGNFSEWY